MNWVLFRIVFELQLAGWMCILYVRGQLFCHFDANRRRHAVNNSLQHFTFRLPNFRSALYQYVTSSILQHQHRTPWSLAQQPFLPTFSCSAQLLPPPLSFDNRWWHMLPDLSVLHPRWRCRITSCWAVKWLWSVHFVRYLPWPCVMCVMPSTPSKNTVADVSPVAIGTSDHPRLHQIQLLSTKSIEAYDKIQGKRLRRYMGVSGNTKLLGEEG